MKLSLSSSFPRYLAAKKSVDDRALNKDVWRALCERLPRGQAEQPLRLLEVGAGIGTMVERVLEWQLVDYASYTALDALPENSALAWQRLPAWGESRGFQVESPRPDQLIFTKPGKRLQLEWITADLFDFLAERAEAEPCDLLLAHAFLDLMPLPETLPLLFRRLRPGGLFYFTLNFDGATLFDPPLDPALDEHIQALYHRTMDERRVQGRPTGGSRSGSRLFTELRRAGAEILQAGASDWVVFASQEGYPQEEAFFLHFILETLRQALQGHPELDEQVLEHWVTTRHQQVESGELSYIAHQLDFLGRLPG